MLYRLLKWTVQLSLRVFYNRIDVTGRQHIPATGPLIVVANHPNTLMDPLLVAAQLKQQLYFLAKSTFFSTPFRERLLRRLHMVPVYRSQDRNENSHGSHHTASANRQTFAQSIEFLKAGGTLLIFPEGTSILERRLRELKTGTARIALDALAQGLPEVLILPVGLNYSDAARFRSNVTINIGAPIRASEFATHTSATAAKALTHQIRERLESLLITTPDAEDDSLVRLIELVYKEKLMGEMGMPATNREQGFALSRGITSVLSYYKQHDPLLVRRLHKRIASYVAALTRLKLSHRQVEKGAAHGPGLGSIATGLAFLVLGFPLFLFGALHNYLPYRLPGLAAGALTEEEEFEAPIMLATGMVSFPVWYGLCIFVFSLWQPSALAVLAYAVSLPVSGFFALFYRNAFLSHRGRWRLLSLTRNRQALVQALQTERQQIITQLEQIRKEYLAKTEEKPGSPTA